MHAILLTLPSQLLLGGLGGGDVGCNASIGSWQKPLWGYKPRDASIPLIYLRLAEALALLPVRSPVQHLPPQRLPRLCAQSTHLNAASSLSDLDDGDKTKRPKKFPR